MIYTWRANMLYGWCVTDSNVDSSRLSICDRFSASNTSRVYNCTMTDHDYFNTSEWGLSNTLTTNQIWDAFVLLSLLEDSVFRQKILSAPHDGNQNHRFRKAMEERNAWVIINGQPDAVRHACNLCMRVFLMTDGTYRMFYCFT